MPGTQAGRTAFSPARRWAGSLGSAAVAAYFDLAYRLLDSPSGRAFLRAAAADGAPESHGYATLEDLDVVIDALDPTSTETLLDLGSGLGEVAFAIHRRTGCRVTGVDASRRAVAEANRRARSHGVDGSVRFVVGDLADPPPGATGAYALDSLMFLRDPIGVMGRLVQALDAPGRLVATLLDVQTRGRNDLVRSLERAGLHALRIDDVTGDLGRRNAARRNAARTLLAGRPGGAAGQLGLLMVLAEEGLVGWQLGRGRMRRWRLVVEALPGG